MNEAANLALVQRLLCDCDAERFAYEDYINVAIAKADEAVTLEERNYWYGEIEYAELRRDDWLVHAEALQELLDNYNKLKTAKKPVSHLANVKIVEGKKIGKCQKCQKEFSYNLYGRNCPHCTPQGVN